jgi:glycosyltransferase involved in cell wall biosynthesis
MLYILTPCSRPYNLKEMHATIPPQAQWVICHDFDDAYIPELSNAIIMKVDKTGQYGVKARNHMLNTIPFKDEDWIYFLDDDNIIHEDFYKYIEFALKLDMYAMVTWAQVDNRGKPRLHSLVKPEIGAIDTASYMVNYKFAKNLIMVQINIHDGIYAEECAKRGPVLTIGKALCHYNKLELSKKKVTILIVNFKTLDLIKRAIEAIRKLTNKDDYDIIALDNGSNDESLEYLRSCVGDDLQLVESSTNLGHGTALDKIAKLVRTPYMFTMDSDAYPTTSEWLNYYLSKMSDKVKCAGSRFEEKRDHVHVSALIIETEVFKKLNMSFVGKGSYLDYGKPDRQAYDVGEKLTWDLRDKGFEVCSDGSFSSFVTHDWAGTQNLAPKELQVLW